MPPHDHSEEELLRENEALEVELRLLGRDPSEFQGLLPQEANVRLKRSIAYAEEAREAELLGKDYHFDVPEPPLPPRRIDEQGMLSRGRMYAR
jgi:hypothetical protein